MSIIDTIQQFFIGDPSKKTLERYQNQVNTINALEPKISKLSDTELSEKINEFKEQLSNGTSIDA